MKAWLEEHADSVIKGLSKCWHCPIGAQTEKGMNLAGQKAVTEVLSDLVSVLFPGCHGNEDLGTASVKENIKARLTGAATELKEQIRLALEYQCTVDHVEDCKECDNCEAKARRTVIETVNGLPEVQKVLQRDIVAAYEGDPAARSTMEGVMSYPGVYAVIVHRVAHLLHLQKVPMIPRIMSEHAHSITGIDIHP